MYVDINVYMSRFGQKFIIKMTKMFYTLLRDPFRESMEVLDSGSSPRILRDRSIHMNVFKREKSGYEVIQSQV